MAGLYRSIMLDLADGIGDIAQEIGTDEDTARGAVATTVPLMIGGLSRLTAEPEGSSALFEALEEEDEEKGFFGNMASMLTSPLALAAGGMMVNRMFGGRKGPIEAGLSSAFGLGRSQTGSLMMAVAPVVLGTLRRRRIEDQLDAAGIAGLLRREEEDLRAESGELNGLMGLLDRDDNGKVMDNIATMGAAVAGAALVRKMFSRD